MYGVVVPDADALRGLISNTQEQLNIKWPYCAYLFYLARHIDEQAVAFLRRYARAVHDETGEAIAVIVLFDAINVPGSVRGRHLAPAIATEPRRRIEDQRIAYGSYPFRTASQVPDQDFDADCFASPRWSLKFADAIGLRRSFLPCLVAFDAVLDPQAPEGIVVDLADADQAWATLRDSMADFMATQAGREFVSTAERLRELGTQVESARSALHRLEGQRSQPRWWPPSLIPATPERLLVVLSQRDHPDRRRVLELADRWSATDCARELMRAVDDVRVLRAAVSYERCAAYLREKWLDASFALRSAPAGVVRRLADSLRLLEQDPSSAEIDRLLAAHVVERSRFVEAVERSGRANLTAITRSLQEIKRATVRAPIASGPGNEQARQDAALRLATRQREEATLRAALVPTPFLPHLAAAIDSTAVPNQSARPHRFTLSNVATTTGVGASVVQILQSIGVIH
ncbi:hypothetical protein ACFRR6_02855 [Streptomyces sp. NPDC056891]|uniref:hypothetical protein n=1 Tax=Streptomyces sp. NPDC056891 TaxID=3345961 RepID=UPI0036978EEE